MAIFCKCSKLFREDDVGVLTLSSRAGKGRNGSETFREDDVGVLTLSSRAWNRAGECIGAGQCLYMSAAFGAELLVDFVLFGHQEVEYIKLED